MKKRRSLSALRSQWMIKNGLMRNFKAYTGTHVPNNDPESSIETTPELPQRERKHGVESARMGMMAVALMATSMLLAQNTPTTPSTPATTPHTTTKHPAHTQTTQGWTRFNEGVGRRLDLKSDQLQRLQEVDSSYQERYTALGRSPWSNPGYASLTEQRDTDIMAILTPKQYEQYTATYGRATHSTAPKTTINKAPAEKP